MPLRDRPFDLVLVCCFALFAFTSLVMEPYFVFGLGFHRPGDPFAAGWRFYAESWDPIFLYPPLALRLICGIDLFVFGPFYLVAIWAFVRQRTWIRVPGLLYVSAMIYSMVVYFGIEFIEERERANLLMVVLVNVPYPIVAMLLGYRLREANPFASRRPG